MQIDQRNDTGIEQSFIHASGCAESRSWRASELMQQHPPRWMHETKAALFAEMMKRPVPDTELRATRHRADLPEVWDRRGAATQTVIEPRAYDYQEDAHAIVWHMNFADEALFGFYGSGLMAQDEWQTLEHPLLGCVREALLHKNAPAPFTLDSAGCPTPFTVTNVPRLCVFDAQPHVYGKHFAHAPLDAVRACVTFPEKATLSNIVAACAPSHGTGIYTYEEIVAALWAAYVAFHSVREETRTRFRSRAKIVLRSGFWGCGAFGGNRELMALVQFIAADMAKVHRFEFYAYDQLGAQTAYRSLTLYEQLRREYGGEDIVSLVDALVAKGYSWGASDGN